MADDRPSDLEPREPTVEDLRDLCRALNERGARYVVTDPENEAKVFSVLSALPDHAASELEPGELHRYQVIRVADEIVVDLMRSAGGILYEEAAKEVVMREVDGVPIPFASPRLLWRMQVVTHREKDAADLVFLRQWFAERAEEPWTI